MEILLMYIQIEKQEIVMEELMKGLGNKQPKVVTGCVQTLAAAIRLDYYLVFASLVPVRQTGLFWFGLNNKN